MDSIRIQTIVLKTRIGVPQAERAKEQELLVDVELFASTKKTAESDSLSHGIDYAAVTADVRSCATGERKTVERLAEDIASIILKNHKPAGGVKVSVWKKLQDLGIDACISIQRS